MKDKIYTNLGQVVADFTYRDFIYFIYNLGMDYYDGLNVVSRDQWQNIYQALKDNYVQYQVEKQIHYRQFRANMAAVLNEAFRKHPSAYQVMNDALTSFGKGNKSAKLKHLIHDFEEHEIIDRELACQQ